jgi:triosephosphate isomerase (TIM)
LFTIAGLFPAASLMRRSVVAANWKMHGSTAMVAALLDELLRFDAVDPQMLILPPAPYLAQVVQRVRGSRIQVGAQNIHPEPAGAFTGETAAEMVADLGATHCLVGHSERRALFGESDVLCAQKFAAARRAGLAPILCVGETGAQRAQGHAVAVVVAQLNAVLDNVGAAAMAGALIAYEPVWAIGTGQTATPQDAQAMHAAIRQRLQSQDRRLAAEMPILYGGSIKPENAAALFEQRDVDGGLVGGASLNAKQFLEICRAAS